MKLMLIVYALVSFLILVLMPEEAFAWGPGMHMHVAMNALAKLAIIAPPIRALMEEHPNDFLYGAVIPDIIVGKKFAGYFHHCHNWSVALVILKEASTPKLRAAAYGYLMHLAADIVAHNYYIPFKIIRSYKARMLSHMYWEIRFDIGVPEKVWRKIDAMSDYHMSEFDILLERVLKKTLFSYKTNKRIFSSLLNVQKIRGLRGGFGVYANRSRWEIGEENRQHYVDLTMESVLDFLKQPNSAACLKVDPTGITRIAYAKDLRSEIKRLLRTGVIDEKSVNKFIGVVQERLAVGLYRPELCLPDISYTL